MDTDEHILSDFAGPFARFMASRDREQAGLGRSISDSALDIAADGIILCDRERRIVYRNAVAEWILTTGFPVERTAGHRVAGVGREMSSVTRAIGEAIRIGFTARFAIESTSHGRFLLRVERDGTDLSLAMIIVRDVKAHTARTVEDSACLYGFTPAETKLAESLILGRSIEEHAEGRGLRVSTVRSHLAALLAKTETARQGQLIAQLMNDPPALHRR